MPADVGSTLGTAGIERANANHELNYALQEVHYSPENSLKDEVFQHSEKFIRSYSEL